MKNHVDEGHLHLRSHLLSAAAFFWLISYKTSLDEETKLLAECEEKCKESGNLSPSYGERRLQEEKYKHDHLYCWSFHSHAKDLKMLLQQPSGIWKSFMNHFFRGVMILKQRPNLWYKHPRSPRSWTPPHQATTKSLVLSLLTWPTMNLSESANVYRQSRPQEDKEMFSRLDWVLPVSPRLTVLFFAAQS